MLKFSSAIASKADADAICAFLAEHEMVNWTVEYDVDGDAHSLCGYFKNKARGQDDFSRIVEAFGNIGAVKISHVETDDWMKVYRKSAKPWQCEDLCWVPTFMKEEFKAPENSVCVYVEPGMAFGSGAHISTQLCGRALVMFKGLYEKTGDLVIKNCIDVGCGSGILGISALKFGFVHATFIDIDEDAIRITQENAQENGIFPDQMDIAIGDFKIELLGRQTDLLMANILADALVKNAHLLVNSIKSGGLLCLGGILRSESAAVMGVFGRIVRDKWESFLENSIDDGEWSTLVYFRA
ncbi:MAG: 50S ribosomal protein L11 methyltransferase [Puniceicoccales bacterium]|jgi:ribosomal protein L11 methyltransferase|nr:50S ribosomal protein L11 methyltransferase [Puniceicoccales bacterium]